MKAPPAATRSARTGVNTVFERGGRTLNQLQAGLLGSSGASDGTELRPGTKRQCRCDRTILSYGKRRYLNGPKQSRHEWIMDNGPMANRQAALILLLLP